jgi:uncharacterized protein with GYD domain
MPTYIALLPYTQQGIAAIKQGPTRLEAAKQAYKKAGGELKAFHLTIGQYDLTIGQYDAVALRAFNEAEFRNIVGELP